MKKILFIITHLELGGAQRELLLLIKNLDPKKYKLFLLAGDYGFLKEDFLKISHLKVYLIKELKREINIFYDIFAFIKIFLYIKKHKFDIIHTHSPKASFLGRWAAFFAGCKNIVYTVHGWPFHKFISPVSYYLYLFLEKLTAKITKKIIVVSKKDLNEGKKITPISKLKLIHYGIETNIFEKVFKERNSNNFIITVSSLKPQKGLKYFLNMAEEVLRVFTDIKFYILGDGPLRKKIKRLIKKKRLDKNVFLLGWQRDITYFYKKTIIFVLTSLWEGLPLSVIEAVISGIPLIVTNTGGVLDIVKNKKQGLVVEFKDIKNLGKICVEMLKNIDEWNRIIKKERERLNTEYWSYQRYIREIEMLYQKL